jgi:hypothetical protein
MKELLDRLPPGLRVSVPVLVSAAAFGVSAYVVTIGVRAVIGAAFESSVDEESANPLVALEGDSSTFIETSRRRFEGRSMYALPPAPVRRPKIVEQPKPVEPPKDPGPPPPPASYTGPMLTSIFGDYVVFSTLSDDDKRIKLGETRAGVTVIEVNAPYSAKLGYQRGEYTVSLWPRINESFLRGGVPSGRLPGLSDGAGAGTSADGSKLPAVSTPASRDGSPGAVPGAAPGGTANGVVGSPTTGAAVGAAGGRPASAGSQPGQSEPSRTGAPKNDPGALPPGDQPGADQPSGPGPGEELPSAAMAPQQIPPPDESGNEGGTEVTEYVDRSTLPAPISAERAGAMSVPEAQRAMRAIDATNNWNVDDHSRARLNHERELLQARVNRGS